MLRDFVRRRLKRLPPRAAQTLPAPEAYALWAPTYADHAHNPLMRAEEAAMRSLMPTLAGQRVLDLACGTGRWGRIARDVGAGSVVGLDFSLPMLRRASLPHRTQASMLALPLGNESIDAVLCGFAIGHVPDLRPFVREANRVLRPGGTLLLSHPHPAGHQAGWQRAFTTPDGRRLAVQHHPHDPVEVKAAFQRAGFVVEKMLEPRVGIDITEPFPGSDAIYQHHHGLPALLIVRARKSAA